MARIVHTEHIEMMKKVEMMRKRDASQHGFSLAELIIVVGIITVVVTIALPGIQSTLESYRLDSAATRLTGKLVDAKMNAIKQNRPVWLTLDLGAGTMQVQCTDPDDPSSTITLGGLEFLPAGITFQSASSDEIAFTALGRPVLGPAAVTLRSRSGTQRGVNVSLTGKVG